MAIVTLWAALVFIGLAAAFGVPLVNGITHLADRMPGYVASAQHGHGWIGHLAARYHVQGWVQRNTPRLAGYAESLAKPALTVGKGAVSVIIELATLFVLVLLLLLEGPKMRELDAGPDDPGPPGHGHPDPAADVSGKVTGYMAGNLLTSLIAGVVVFVTLLILGVPFPAAVGPVGGPGGLPADDRRGAGGHPHRPVRVHRRGPPPRASSPRPSSPSTPRSRTTS